MSSTVSGKSALAPRIANRSKTAQKRKIHRTTKPLIDTKYHYRILAPMPILAKAFRHREFQRVFQAPCRSASVCIERPGRRRAFCPGPVWNPRLLGVSSRPTLKPAPHAASRPSSPAALVWRGFQGMPAANAQSTRTSGQTSRKRPIHAGLRAGMPQMPNPRGLPGRLPGSALNTRASEHAGRQNQPCPPVASGWAACPCV